MTWGIKVDRKKYKEEYGAMPTPRGYVWVNTALDPTEYYPKKQAKRYKTKRAALEDAIEYGESVVKL